MADSRSNSAAQWIGVGLVFLLGAAACTSGSTVDAGSDAGEDAGHDAGVDGGVGVGTDAGGCFLLPDGVNGLCLDAGDCSALPGHTSEPDTCAGTYACCIQTPDPADNPPIPAGWMLLPQSVVTPAMTSWAVTIQNDPNDFPMFSSSTQQFGALNVLAIVNWAPPDFSNESVHRGVTLFEPTGDGG